MQKSILTVHTDAWHGGAAKVSQQVHHFIRQSNQYRTIYLSGRGVSDKEKNIISLCQKKLPLWFNVFYYRLLGSENPATWPLWNRHIGQDYFNADLIHLHNGHGYYLPDSIYQYWHQKPVIWTLHDFWVATGRCAIPKQCKGWQQSCQKCPDQKNYPASIWNNYKKTFFKKRTLLKDLKYLTITVPSNTFKKDLEKFELPVHDIRVISNGINTDIYKPANHKEKSEIFKALNVTSEEGPIVTYICNKPDEPGKGLRYLVSACHKLKKKINLYIIGQKSALLQQFKGIDKVQVHLVGYIKQQEEIAAWLKISDLFINTSLSETFGLITLESLSCGVRPLIFDLPIYRETMKEYATTIPVGNSDMLAISIDNLAQKSFSEKEKYNAHQYVYSEFSEKKMGESFLNLYDEKLNKK